MDSEGDFPLDISEFKCTTIGKARVVVTFEQTNRRYIYSWHEGRLDLGRPEIEGEAAPHVPEVIDCLARAVAYKAVQDAAASHKSPPDASPTRKAGSLLRGLLNLR